MVSRCRSLSALLYTVAFLYLGFSLLIQSAAYAQNISYYAPPAQINTGLLFDYSDAYSQDYVNLNPNPVARFGISTAAFHYDADKKTLSNLRVSITTGSVTSPDKDYTWILIGRSGLDVNDFDEIVIYSTGASTLDQDGKTTIDALMTLRGITSKVKIETKLGYVQDNNALSSMVSGEKGAARLSLVINFKFSEFNMAPVDNENRSRGDQGIMRIEMRALRQ